MNPDRPDTARADEPRSRATSNPDSPDHASRHPAPHRADRRAPLARLPRTRLLRPGWLGPACLWALATAAQAFDAQGHRGARGLAPENTVPAFDQALAIGVQTLELDIGLTADNVVVVGHDPVLNPAIVREPSGRWLAAPGPSIRSLTLAQLQAYDVGRIDPQAPFAKTFATQQPCDGTRMPTLAALFARVRLGRGRPHHRLSGSPARGDGTQGPAAAGGSDGALTPPPEAGGVPPRDVATQASRSLRTRR